MAADRELARGRNIPPVPQTAHQQGRAPFDLAVKENLERILGRVGNREVGVGGEIPQLSPAASLLEVILTVNAILERLR